MAKGDGMKRYFLCILIIVLYLSSCKMKEEPQYTPQFALSEFVVRHADPSEPKDTIKVQNIGEDIVIDTIAVGDTVHFAILCNAVTNQLTSFEVKTDTAVLGLTMQLSDQHTKALEATSDIENFKLVFKPGYGAASIPMEYIARKSVTATLTFNLATTSEFSPASLVLKQPIK